MEKTVGVTECSSSFGKLPAPRLAHRGDSVYAMMRPSQVRNAEVEPYAAGVLAAFGMTGFAAFASRVS